MTSGRRKPSPFAQGTARPDRDPASKTKILKILVVDDEPSMRQLLLRIFRQHQTAEAQNVEEAKALLDHDDFDVVISDNSMPGPCGIELLAHIEVFHPEVHRILFSATPPRDLASLVDQGVIQAFVPKTDLRELVELCASRLRRGSRPLS